MSQKQKLMQVAGIDGCRFGWCVVSFANSKFEMSIFPGISEAAASIKDATDILVDIPIGLGDEQISRDVDRIARESLTGSRRASIFIPPVREAAYCDDYEQAKNVNKGITGKMISIQSWNITPKIREVDAYLTSNRPGKVKLHEAHPEICFRNLNEGRELQYGKNEAGNKGINERIDILSRYEPDVRYFVKSCEGQHPKSKVKIDDIVDATCLAVTAKLGSEKGYASIKGSNLLDSKGLEMKLVYVAPHL